MPKKTVKNAADATDSAVTNGPVVVPEDSIGQRIKDARQLPENSLSVEALSRLCRECDPQGQGISRTALVRYESGEIKPGAREIRIICRALELTADWLVLGQKDSRKPAIEETLGLLRRVIEKEFVESHEDKTDVYEKFARQEALKRAKSPPSKQD